MGCGVTSVVPSVRMQISPSINQSHLPNLPPQEERHGPSALKMCCASVEIRISNQIKVSTHYQVLARCGKTVSQGLTKKNVLGLIRSIYIKKHKGPGDRSRETSTYRPAGSLVTLEELKGKPLRKRMATPAVFESVYAQNWDG